MLPHMISYVTVKVCRSQFITEREQIINLNNTTGAISDAGISSLHETHEYSISDVSAV